MVLKVLESIWDYREKLAKPGQIAKPYSFAINDKIAESLGDMARP